MRFPGRCVSPQEKVGWLAPATEIIIDGLEIRAGISSLSLKQSSLFARVPPR